MQQSIILVIWTVWSDTIQVAAEYFLIWKIERMEKHVFLFFIFIYFVAKYNLFFLFFLFILLRDGSDCRNLFRLKLVKVVHRFEIDF